MAKDKTSRRNEKRREELESRIARKDRPKKQKSTTKDVGKEWVSVGWEGVTPGTIFNDFRKLMEGSWGIDRGVNNHLARMRLNEFIKGIPPIDDVFEVVTPEN